MKIIKVLEDLTSALQSTLNKSPLEYLTIKEYEEHDCKNSPEDGCEVCAGTGEETTLEWDSDSGNYQPTGTAKCYHLSCDFGDGEDYTSIQENNQI